MMKILIALKVQSSGGGLSPQYPLIGLQPNRLTHASVSIKTLFSCLLGILSCFLKYLLTYWNKLFVFVKLIIDY